MRPHCRRGQANASARILQRRRDWLSGQYGDRRNISAQPRRANISSGRCEKIAEATASARILHSALWWLRSDAVLIGLSGQYGDRRNISAQMRRENVSSVPALQRGLTPKRRHQDLPFHATRPAADPIFSHLPVPALQRVLSLKRCHPIYRSQARHLRAALRRFATPPYCGAWLYVPSANGAKR